MKWKDVTNYFTEEQRHYKNTYLEIDYERFYIRNCHNPARPKLPIGYELPSRTNIQVKIK